MNDSVPTNSEEHAEMLSNTVMNMAANAKRAVQRTPQLAAFLPPAGAAMLDARFRQFGDAMAYASLCHDAYTPDRDRQGISESCSMHIRIITPDAAHQMTRRPVPCFRSSGLSS